MTTGTPNLIHNTLEHINRIILGKQHQVQLAFCCLLAEGHLLLEDLPGMGKTTLAHGLAHVCGLDYKRVQFTNDLLPADLLGSMIFEQQQFRFHPGPIFTPVLLADELNRATPKAQSALLEAMEEHQVSIDGQSHALPEPFFVIATQNPHSQFGTYPLPESQLDRFLMRLSLGYPDPEAERAMLLGQHGRESLKHSAQILNADRLQALQSVVSQIKLSNNLLDYIQRLLAQSRQDELCLLGLSPRGAQALVKSTQAWALLQGRNHALPEDVQAVFIAVANHRLIGRRETQGEALARHILTQVDVIGDQRV